jgi:uncharacterized protein (TIGR00645 family)
VATAILTISAVQLLQVFLDMEKFTEKQILWKVVIHVVFILSALALAVLDQITGFYADRRKLNIELERAQRENKPY